MKITVHILPDNTTQKINVPTPITIEQLILQLNLKPDTVIITKNNTPLPIDETLDDDQELNIIRVASGG